MSASLTSPEQLVSSAPADPARRYRVLFVATHPVQYASPVFREMARHPELDITVAYCSLRGAEAAHDAGFGVEVKWDVPLLDGYPWTRIPNRSRRPGLERFFGLINPGLWKLIRTGRFDTIILLTGYVYATFWIGLLASKLNGVPVIFGTDATTLEPREGGSWKRGVKRVLKRAAWPLLFRLADQVLTLSTGGRDLMRSLGIPENRIALIPFVVDNDAWLAAAARANRAAVRESWRFAPSAVVILYCAKLQPWKRPLDLLRAFAAAAEPDAALVFAGDGALREQIETEAVALGIRDRVHMLGFVNQTQLASIYTAADILVLPSEYEPFAVVVNEAMLCARPVIASDRVGAARDLIVSGRTGFVYPCGDVAALARLLRTTIANRDSLPEMGRAARERMSTWSPREYIAATIEAIARIVARRDQSSMRAGFSAHRKNESSSVALAKDAQQERP